MKNKTFDDFSKLVNNYKQLIRADHNFPEIYKWECVKQYQTFFDIDSPDFERVLRDSIKKVKNLVYVNSLGFLIRAAKHLPEEVREMFKNLYDEKIDFQKRMDDFQTEAKNILPDVIRMHGKPLNHQQDERTISFYMAMRFPEKYPIFKNDLYNLLLEVFPEEQPRKAGKKYFHFIELCERVVPIIENDSELLDLSKSTLNAECYTGRQSLLIFQDILWRNRKGNDANGEKEYFLVGSYWEGVDKTSFFVENGVWENGYDGKFTEETNSIVSGSRIAIKAPYVEAKTKSVMAIKAIGTVIENFNDGRNLAVDWDSDFSQFKVDFSGGYRSTVHRLKNTDHIKSIFFHSQNVVIKETKMKAQNIILYGPPGTGKTYNSIDKAIEIALGKSLGSHDANKLEFDRLRKEGQIEFVTFHQNYSYEDFMVGIAPDLAFAGGLRFDRKEGIFKRLSDLAKKNWLDSTELSEPRIDFEYVFNSFFSKLIEEEVQSVEIPMRLKSYQFKITNIDIDEGRIKFTKKSGGTGHDLLIKNVKGIYEGTLDYALEGLGVYYYPLDEQLKQHAITMATSAPVKTELKNYVLVIDEINRANISKVFGELITLLEEDKRLGEVNELRISLPSGEKEFGIPPNIHIVGTMNTADKSIALVDIALRRRFEFIGKYPSYDKLLSEEVSLLKAINEAVYEEKKSADYLIGHAYFMKHQPIEDVLSKKVIPLLMEYFSGRTETIMKVFGNTDWIVTYNKTTYSWDINKKN